MAQGRDPKRDGGGSGLSLQTLIVASLASLTAAIVTSHFWRGGTPITAALTPVIVALASELYRRPAARITQLGSRAAAVRTRERERVTSGAPPERRVPRTEVPEGPGAIRVYRTGGKRRRFHLKVVLLTAAAAFAIAVGVLTLPELVFGGSLASHGRTTFFGSSTRHHHSTSTTTTVTTSTHSSSTSSPATTTVTVPAPAAQQPQTTTTQTAPLGASGPTGP